MLNNFVDMAHFARIRPITKDYTKRMRRFQMYIMLALYMTDNNKK